MGQLCTGSGKVKNSNSSDGGKEVRVMSNKGENRSGGGAVKKTREKHLWSHALGLRVRTKRTETMCRDDYSCLDEGREIKKRHFPLVRNIRKWKTSRRTLDKPKSKGLFQSEEEEAYRTSADFISQRSFTNQTENCPQRGLRISSGIPEGHEMRCFQGMKNKINGKMNSNRVSALSTTRGPLFWSGVGTDWDSVKKKFQILDTMSFSHNRTL